MTKLTASSLSRRERQIMDILYRRGRATAGEVMEELSGDPTYFDRAHAAARARGKRPRPARREGLRYVYMPAVPRSAARKSALRHLVDTFFDGSAENAVAALLGGEGARLSDEAARSHRGAREEGEEARPDRPGGERRT